MDLHHLWLFYKVAQNLSFTKTAEELFISQPTISVQVKKLENDLGLKLIEKYGKQIYLTNYGKIVYSYAEKIFIIINELENEISSLKGNIQGTLNIGASNTPGIYILPYIMGIFKERYPDVKNNLHIGNTYEIQNVITLNQVDFAIIGGKIELPKSFYIEKLIDDALVIVASPNNPLSEYSVIDKRMLMGQLFIGHERNSNLYNAMEYIVTRDIGLPLNIAMTLGSIDAIKHAVYANLGISIVPMASVKKDIKSGSLKILNVENKQWKYAYNLVYHRDKFITLPAKKMIQTIKEKIGDILEN